jgi:dTDP-4-dehydrorhamnose reductase
MKIVVTGFNGQLGYDVYNNLINRGYKNILGIGSNDLDITNQ